MTPVVLVWAYRNRQGKAMETTLLMLMDGAHYSDRRRLTEQWLKTTGREFCVCYDGFGNAIGLVTEGYYVDLWDGEVHVIQ